MKRRYQLIVYRDNAGEYRWRLFVLNGNVIADSGEGYSTRASAIRAARRLTVIAAEAGIVK